MFKYEPERFKERNKKISRKLKGRVPWNKGKKTGKQSTELVKKRTKNSKKPRSMISYYQEKYPLLFKANSIRENKKKQIEVRCKTCNKFFVVKRKDLYERIRALEGNVGWAENNLYCSDKCKFSCSIYRKRTDTQNTLYTQEEYQVFRTFVLNRDNYICQYCGEKAEHVHHERPQKLEPFFALDPEFAWSVCKTCHYEKGHPRNSECSTGKIASIIC